MANRKYAKIILVVSLVVLVSTACGGSKSYVKVEKTQFVGVMQRPVIIPLYMEQNIFPQAKIEALGLKFSAEYQTLVNKNFKERARRFDDVLLSVLGKGRQTILAKPLLDSDVSKAPLASHGEFSSHKIYESEYFFIKPEKIAALSKMYPEASSFVFHFANVQRTWGYFRLYKGYVVMPQAAIWYNVVVYDRQGKIVYGGIEETQGQTDAYSFSPKQVTYKEGNYKLLALEKEELDSAWKGRYKIATIEPSAVAWVEIEAETFKKQMLDTGGLYRELALP
jgi:hypothetical protein